MKREKTPAEIEALALLKKYAASDLEFRLKAFSDQNLLVGGTIDCAARRTALRDCLDDLNRE